MLMPRSDGCRVTEAHRQECLCHWSHESRQDAGATRDAKRNSKDRSDVMGYFFQVGYEALHFFVAGGVIWGAQDGRGVDCGHHVRG